MKINRLQQPSRTAKSYGEVKMDLFVPPGGKTKNWYVRVYIPVELRELYGKEEFRQSTRTTDRVLADARAAAFSLEKSKEFLAKRELLTEFAAERAQKVVLDASLIRKIAHIRLASLVRFDDQGEQSRRSRVADADGLGVGLRAVGNEQGTNHTFQETAQAPRVAGVVLGPSPGCGSAGHHALA